MYCIMFLLETMSITDSDTEDCDESNLFSDHLLLMQKHLAKALEHYFYIQMLTDFVYARLFTYCTLLHTHNYVFRFMKQMY